MMYEPKGIWNSNGFPWDPCQRAKVLHSSDVSYLEKDVVEAPRLGGEDRGKAELSLLDEESEIDGTGTGVASSP